MEPSGEAQSPDDGSPKNGAKSDEVLPDAKNPKSPEEQDPADADGGASKPVTETGNGASPTDNNEDQADSLDSSSDGFDGQDVNEVLYGTSELKDDIESDQALSVSGRSDDRAAAEVNEDLGFEGISSAQSLSTATQTHEVRMPMYLPTFKPATGCTNASDFIVRCFVARLRSGITVVKHGRSRWCKSRLRILHIHPDGRSLSWKPAQGVVREASDALQDAFEPSRIHSKDFSWSLLELLRGLFEHLHSSSASLKVSCHEDVQRNHSSSLDSNQQASDQLTP